jgi:hypothetical protein
MSQYGQGVPQGTQYQEQTNTTPNPPLQANNNLNYQPHPQSDYPPTEPRSMDAAHLRPNKHILFRADSQVTPGVSALCCLQWI